MNQLEWQLKSKTYEQILDASREHRLDVMNVAWWLRAQSAISTAIGLHAQSAEIQAESTRAKATSRRLIGEVTRRNADADRGL